MARQDDTGWYGPGRPRRTRGGIRAQSRQAGFARHWWGKRWLDALEGIDVGTRLSRGRSYARAGQVRSIEIGAGKVTASVQGSRPDPYEVEIKIRVLSREKWRAVGAALAGRTVLAARLLAGEMPEKIEEAFTDAGAALFPGRKDDLQTRCSCPDDANPCKHIAAVYYLLGEEFDRDPFLLFQLRGMSRHELSEAILSRQGDAERVDAEREADAADVAIREPTWGVEEAEALDGDTSSGPALIASGFEPLPSEPGSFWGSVEAKTAPAEETVRIPPVAAALAKRLGSFPFWRGERPFLPTLERIYAAASEAGLDIFLGEPESTADERDRGS